MKSIRKANLFGHSKSIQQTRILSVRARSKEDSRPLRKSAQRLNQHALYDSVFPPPSSKFASDCLFAQSKGDTQLGLCTLYIEIKN